MGEAAKHRLVLTWVVCRGIFHISSPSKNKIPCLGSTGSWRHVQRSLPFSFMTSESVKTQHDVPILKNPLLLPNRKLQVAQAAGTIFRCSMFEPGPHEPLLFYINPSDSTSTSRMTFRNLWGKQSNPLHPSSPSPQNTILNKKKSSLLGY